MYTETCHAHAPSKAAIQSHAILAAARKSAQRYELPYAGNVTPEQAWTLLSAGIAELIDLRTDDELRLSGHVPGAAHLEWLSGARMTTNPLFISKLGSLVGKGNVVLFLCRSGKRSAAAAQAATEAGYRNVFNVLEGFHGNGNPQSGWLNRRLPSVTN